MVNVEHFHIWSLYIFCNPLLHNIVQVKCLTSLKVKFIKKKKKLTLSLDTVCRVWGVTHILFIKNKILFKF